MWAWRKWQVRWLLAGVLAVGVGASSTWAAESEPSATASSGPRPQVREAELDIPAAAVPRAADGERLVLTLPGMETQVVELRATVGDAAIVMLPTGELRPVPSSAATPTDKPFVGADEAAIKSALAEEGLSNYKVVSSGPYVYAYDCSEGYFLHTRSIMESMFPGVVKCLRGWGLQLQRPSVPLVVVIMPNRQAFDAYDKVSPTISAYYHQLSNWVVLYEDQALWEAAPDYAAKQAAYVVAHEGVHQILHNTGVQKRLSRWPSWISEGLPEYFCPLKVNTKLVKYNDAELPTRMLRWTEPGMVNDIRMHSLLQINAQDGAVAHNLVRDSELDADEYALAWGLVHYLATEQPQKFRAYLADVSKLEPYDPLSRGAAGRTDPLFVKHFGEDFPAIEAAVQEHLLSKPLQAAYVDPIANQTHYVVKRIVKQARTFHVALMITTSPAAARNWKEAQEAEFKKAKFFTKVCKSQAEAEYQLKKLQSL